MNAVDIRCEWGANGIASLREVTDVFIIVDVLSFTTCVDIAVSRGVRVYPYVWNDMSSVEFVTQIGGTMAVSSGKPGFSLSAATLLEIPAGTKLVLPSPNGSTLSLMTGAIPTLAGCLRNARAVARSAQRLGKRVSVIPGGERWKDNSLRVAIEDWLGAGAIIAEMEANLSAEALLARSVYETAAGQIEQFVLESISGRELITRGRIQDVELALEMNISTCAPLLKDRAFTDGANILY